MSETSQPQFKILKQSVTKNTSRKLTYMIKMSKTKHISRTRIKSQLEPPKFQPRERRNIHNIRTQILIFDLNLFIDPFLASCAVRVTIIVYLHVIIFYLQNLFFFSSIVLLIV
jgi:hypothetical protein